MLTALIPGYKYQYWYGIIMRFGIGMGLDVFFVMIIAEDVDLLNNYDFGI